ncbi:hypothetical protein HYDPIDRAFT_111721 [Hydnomerulius pinastri MD-312]|uniref:F-box domain-containing protein n=1 Tax=Hydnomerulius pinastri MD-312 TaxID=994086 RepID=A0A0C9WFR3_9AGAM|nr:hypothetical protein HYDPIDRAFT_111721 [Hydnomerulius pinastri MD-312]
MAQVGDQPINALDSQPNELMLELFAYLPLRSLIAARGVCTKWRRFVDLSNLLPVRRRLLDFYLLAIKSPSFLAARQMIVPQLQVFDREEYLGKLLVNFVLPEEFEFYIREWPAKAAVSWVWPGLDNTFLSASGVRMHGRNWLGRTIDNSDDTEIFFPGDTYEDDGDMTPLRALELWEHGCAWSDWLVCDKTKDNSGRSHFGEVYACEGEYVDWENTDKPNGSSWIDWLKLRVKADDRALERTSADGG